MPHSRKPSRDKATRPDDGLTREQIDSFRKDGFLVLPNVIHGAELEALQEETLRLVERARDDPRDPDFKYRTHEVTGERVPFRIEYVIDKTSSAKALLGHPSVLRAVGQLQGPRFIPTWDSMVFKEEGQGAAIPWHRDAGRRHQLGDTPIFNVDFYLDASDRTNCLWAIPGSQRWSDDEAARTIDALSAGGFQTEGAVSLELAPGDVLLHDILTVHGSPPARSGLRRVLYFEFRPVDTELAIGPHVPEYVALKQCVLLAAIEERRRTSHARNERPFEYSGELLARGDEPLTTWRYPHEQFWRQASG